MILAVILAFAIGYFMIVFEHPLKIDKTVSAFAMGAFVWALLALGFHNGSLDIINGHGDIFNMHSGGDLEHIEDLFSGNLLHHLGAIAEILVFLIGAMTIVEIIDTHKGFEIMKKLIDTKSKVRLLWIVGILGFFLSAIIDNLTATIVLITILRKLINSPKERMFYAGLIVIAANAGGAWSPIGDVTTTMLWISKKVSVGGLATHLILPSVVCMLVPFAIASFMPAFKGNIHASDAPVEKDLHIRTSNLMLVVGLLAILFVPVFKTITHLPPYIGMMLSLSIVWLIAEFSVPLPNMTDEMKEKFEAKKALAKIDLSSILFFLGILLAVAGLESLCVENYGSLRYLAESIKTVVPNLDIVGVILGVLSAIIDNVPLVAASIGMFTDAMDAKIWHLIALTAGTGGSMLIIGSAAGVAAMGMEKIDFIWYLKNISWLAALGYISGVLFFLGEAAVFGF